MKTISILTSLLLAITGLSQTIPVPATLPQATNGVAQGPYINPVVLNGYNNAVILPEILANGGGSSTNGLATTNWVWQSFYPTSNPSLFVTAAVTNGLVTAAITNGLATTNFVNGATVAVATNAVTGVNGNIVTVPQISTGVNGFVWTASYNTNAMVSSGFVLPDYTSPFYWNAGLACKDILGANQIGNFTNSSGVCLIYCPGVTEYTLSKTTNAVNGYDYFAQSFNWTNGQSFTKHGTNVTGGGVLTFAMGQTNLSLSVGPFAGNVTATNGTVLVPSYNQSAPTWMWNAFGSGTFSGMTAYTLTNHIGFYKGIGLDPYIDGYMEDAGIWTGTNSLGNLAYNTNNWAAVNGLFGAYNYVHTNTYNKTFILWTGVGAASPTLADMTNIVTCSDGVSIDSGGVVPPNQLQTVFENEVSNFRGVAAVFNKIFPLTSNLAQSSFGMWVPSELVADNLFILVPDNISSYATFVTALHVAYPYLGNLHQGQYVKFPCVWIDSYTNAVQSMLLMYQCALPASGFYGDDSTTNNLSLPNMMLTLTNADVHAIYKDGLLAHGFKIMNTLNGQSELWGRRLSGNRAVIVFWNTSYSSSDAGTMTFRATDLGYPMGQQFAVKRIFLNTNTVFTDSMTVSGLDAASSQGYLLTPIEDKTFGNVTATNFTGNGSGLTNLNAGNISSGAFSVTLVGDGSGMTNLNASNLSSGTVATNLLPGLLPNLSTGNGITLTNIPYAKGFTSTNGYWTPTLNVADGSTNLNFVVTNIGLSSLPAAQLAGTVPLAQLPAYLSIPLTSFGSLTTPEWLAHYRGLKSSTSANVTAIDLSTFLTPNQTNNHTYYVNIGLWATNSLYIFNVANSTLWFITNNVPDNSFYYSPPNTPFQMIGSSVSQLKLVFSNIPTTVISPACTLDFRPSWTNSSTTNLYILYVNMTNGP